MMTRPGKFQRCVSIVTVVCSMGLCITKAQAYGYSLGWGCPFGAAELNKPEAQVYLPWLFRTSTGSTISPSTAFTLICFNTPFRDFIVSKIVDDVKKKANPRDKELGLDAVWWGVYGDEWCCCDYCKKAYRARFGKDLPIVNVLRWGEKLSPSEIRQAIEWRRDSLENVYREIVTKVKAIRPDIAITIHGLTGFYFDSGDLLSRANHLRMSDFVYTENYQDETFKEAWMRGVARKPTHNTHTPYFSDSWSIQDPISLYVGDVFRGVVSGLLANGCLSMATGVQDGTKDIKILKELVDNEIKGKRQYVEGASPVLYAAIVYSEAVKIYYRRGDPEKSPLPGIQGAWEVMQRLHLPVEFLSDMDLDLENLKKFQVVILPNTAILSPPQAAAIRQYVKDGGSILSTYETSLYDESGERKINFDLSDVLGLKYAGRSVRASDIVPVGGFLTHLQGVRSAYYDQALRVTRGSVVTEPRTGITKATCNVLSPEPKLSSIPSVHFNNFGDGKSAYASADLFRLYRTGSEPYAYPPIRRDTFGMEFRDIPFMYSRMGWIADLCGEVLSWLAPNPPFKVEGSPLLGCTFFAQKEKGRFVVHLYNRGVEKLGQAFDLEPAKLLIRKDFAQPRKIYTVWPARTDLEVRDNGADLEVRAPKTRISQIIIIERQVPAINAGNRKGDSSD